MRRSTAIAAALLVLGLLVGTIGLSKFDRAATTPVDAELSGGDLAAEAAIASDTPRSTPASPRVEGLLPNADAGSTVAATAAPGRTATDVSLPHFGDQMLGSTSLREVVEGETSGQTAMAGAQLALQLYDGVIAEVIASYPDIRADELPRDRARELSLAGALVLQIDTHDGEKFFAHCPSEYADHVSELQRISLALVNKAAYLDFIEMRSATLQEHPNRDDFHRNQWSEGDGYEIRDAADGVVMTIRHSIPGRVR